MALKNKAGNVAGTPGGFEQEDVAVLDRPDHVVLPSDQATAVASTAIAKAAGTSLVAASAPAPRGKLVMLLDDRKDALPHAEFGVRNRLTGSNGLVMDKDKRKLGEWVSLEVVSWSDEYVISPGVDDAEAKEAVKYSRDNVTIDSTGQSVIEYLKLLREVEGYPGANVKQYCQVTGILKASEKEVPELADSLVQISLSPQSRKLFEGYREQESVKAYQGKRTAEGFEMIKFKADVKSRNGKDYTLLQASAA